MEVFRISTTAFSETLSCSGVASRWNLDGDYVLYTGSSRSLSTLELVVHLNDVTSRSDFKLMTIHVGNDEELVEHILIKDLVDNWRSLDAYSTLQKIGSAWYKDQRSLLLKVPSAVIPNEYNYVINASHPLFHDKVLLIGREDYFFDERLFKRE